jgi:hypothetical protein
VAHEDGSEKILCQSSTFAMSIRHSEKLDDIVRVIEATRGIEAVALALNDPRGLDEEMSGSRTSS